ncbi:MAG: division/cell wall cluster transcriptional repressor MraZ [Saprospiraceae bacterium]|nr:division/cell wall cluster transcriptional repressor MraZ [Saprospiraceae bacterium]MDW8229785.1 division/cell wall cluster transcriptional repressor MraZ [Saprospiraceae bacterium]
MKLLGEYPVSIDNKGRLRLPTALLRQLGEPTGEEGGYEFVVNRGFEGTLWLYPKAVWEVFSDRVNRLNRFNERNRKLIRFFYSGATALTTDSADRILLPKMLMDYAGLTDEAILVSIRNYIEIWSPERYTAMLSQGTDDITDLANDVLGGGEEGVGAEDLFLP